MRRLDPFLDPLIAVVAVGLALASLLTTDVDTIDPRLHDADLLAAVATVVAAGSLAWRRRRPMASYAVFVAGALVVSGTFHYIGLLSILMLLSLFSLATYGSRRDGLVGLGVGIASFVGLGRRASRTCGPRTCCSPSRCWSRRGRSPRRCGPGGSSRASGCAPPSPRSGCGSPASCTTSWRTACP